MELLRCLTEAQHALLVAHPTEQLVGVLEERAHVTLLFFLYLLLDYRWFVTFDNYLRKKKNK